MVGAKGSSHTSSEMEDFVKLVYRMADASANREAEEQEDLCVNKRRWDLTETKTMRVGIGSAKTGSSGCEVMICAVDKRGVVCRAQTCALALVRCSAMQSEMMGCDVFEQNSGCFFCSWFVERLMCRTTS